MLREKKRSGERERYVEREIWRERENKSRKLCVFKKLKQQIG